MTSQDIKEQFSKVSGDRYELPPEEIQQAVEEMLDRSVEVPLQLASEDIYQIFRVRRNRKSLRGGERRYIQEACAELSENVISLIQDMFSSRAQSWGSLLKYEQIEPIFRKGDRNLATNHSGVCLLAMIVKY